MALSRDDTPLKPRSPNTRSATHRIRRAVPALFESAGDITLNAKAATKDRPIGQRSQILLKSDWVWEALEERGRVLSLSGNIDRRTRLVSSLTALAARRRQSWCRRARA